MAQHTTPIYGFKYWDQNDRPQVFTAPLAASNWTLLESILAGLPSAGDVELGLKFFRDRSLVPTTVIKSGTGLPASFDFQNIDPGSSGSQTLNDSIYIVGTKSASAAIQNVGWNLGITASKVLFIIGGIIPGSANIQQSGFWIGQTTPPAFSTKSVPPNAYVFKFDVPNQRLHVVRTDASGNETIISNDSGSTPTPPDTRDIALYTDLFNNAAPHYFNSYAMLVNGTAVSVWFRLGPSTWIPIYAIADTTITSFGFAGFWWSGSGGVEGRTRWLGPMYLGAQ